MCLAIPGRVVRVVDDADGLALVDIGGVRRTVNISLLDRAKDAELVGRWVLIHVGFALSQVDEQEALATLELLRQMGDDYDRELRELAEGEPR